MIVYVFSILSVYSLASHILDYVWESRVRKSINKIPLYLLLLFLFFFAATTDRSDRNKNRNAKLSKNLSWAFFTQYRSLLLSLLLLLFSIYYKLHIIIYIYDCMKHWLVSIANSFSWFLSSFWYRFIVCCFCCHFNRFNPLILQSSV